MAAEDAVALVDGRPVATAELWRTLLGRAPGPGPLVLVHPSWWPHAMVDRVAGLAPGGPVSARTRAEVISAAMPAPVVVVEIAADRVAVSVGEVLRLFGVHNIGAIADAVSGLTRGAAAVAVDVPRGVPGAARTAGAVQNALESLGVASRLVQITAVATAAGGSGQPRASRRRTRVPVVVAAVALVALVVSGLVAMRPQAAQPAAPEPAPERWASLVEGRVTVRIPPDWAVRRVTSGAGSRRVEVSSPGDPEAVVHITQAYAPGTTLADAAEALGRAVAAGPAGVFTDFHPDDQVNGRPAVTYREIRPARTVRWTVVVDGATRISVGCQNAAKACAEAVSSARELTGPQPAPGKPF